MKNRSDKQQQYFEEILKELISLLPSSYNKEINDTNFYKLLRSLAVDLSDAKVEIEEVKDDMYLNTVSPDFLYNNFGTLVKLQKRADWTDEQYRGIIKGISNSLLKGPTKETMIESFKLFTDLTVNVYELYKDKDIVDPALISGYNPKYTFVFEIQRPIDHFVEQNLLEEDARYVIKIIKPAHTIGILVTTLVAEDSYRDYYRDVQGINTKEEQTGNKYHDYHGMDKFDSEANLLNSDNRFGYRYLGPGVLTTIKSKTNSSDHIAPKYMLYDYEHSDVLLFEHETYDKTVEDLAEVALEFALKYDKAEEDLWDIGLEFTEDPYRDSHEPEDERDWLFEFIGYEEYDLVYNQVRFQLSSATLNSQLNGLSVLGSNYPDEVTHIQMDLSLDVELPEDDLYTHIYLPYEDDEFHDVLDERDWHYESIEYETYQLVYEQDDAKFTLSSVDLYSKLNSTHKLTVGANDIYEMDIFTWFDDTYNIGDDSDWSHFELLHESEIYSTTNEVNDDIHSSLEYNLEEVYEYVNLQGFTLSSGEKFSELNSFSMLSFENHDIYELDIIFGVKQESYDGANEEGYYHIELPHNDEEFDTITNLSVERDWNFDYFGEETYDLVHGQDDAKFTLSSTAIYSELNGTQALATGDRDDITHFDVVLAGEEFSTPNDDDYVLLELVSNSDKFGDIQDEQTTTFAELINNEKYDVKSNNITHFDIILAGEEFALPEDKAHNILELPYNNDSFGAVHDEETTSYANIINTEIYDAKSDDLASIYLDFEQVFQQPTIDRDVNVELPYEHEHFDTQNSVIDKNSNHFESTGEEVYEYVGLQGFTLSSGEKFSELNSLSLLSFENYDEYIVSVDLVNKDKINTPTDELGKMEMTTDGFQETAPQPKEGLEVGFNNEEELLIVTMEAVPRFTFNQTPLNGGRLGGLIRDQVTMKLEYV